MKDEILFIHVRTHKQVINSLLFAPLCHAHIRQAGLKLLQLFAALCNRRLGVVRHTVDGRPFAPFEKTVEQRQQVGVVAVAVGGSCICTYRQDDKHQAE